MQDIYLCSLHLKWLYALQKFCNNLRFLFTPVLSFCVASMSQQLELIEIRTRDKQSRLIGFIRGFTILSICISSRISSRIVVQALFYLTITSHV